MKPRNVLVFPAGTEIGLEIHAALKDLKEVRLFAAGQAVANHAELLYGAYHPIPAITEPGWMDALAALCRKLEIDYVFPAYDDVIVALAEAREQLPAKLIAPSLAACVLTRSKSLTYDALQDVVRVPRRYRNADAVRHFPVFVKPDRGQGSFATTLVHDRPALDAALASTPAPLICEYLPGEEFTVDCFSDREQGLLFAGARVRRRMRNGIAVNTKSVALPEIQGLAAAIGDKLGLHGAWFFQVKRAAGGELALLEVAPRIAGSMATHRVQGVNFPMLAIYEEERAPISVLLNPGAVELDRALGNRYLHTVHFDTLYLDLDDTLILRGKVNTELVQLVFHCINHGKRVVLITRHEADLQQTLKRHRLARLFDQVIHLPRSEKKSDHVSDPSAIFIDDSFAERLDVSRARGIPTFDCSMVELLNNSFVD